ncbi:hypothetical protein [Maridesulfovibrio hydrothermalis]|uniref:Uncharacterized protein n=1 Tax=Maridesulfovibrio hydrothermalis AM13 = DSM 14728 TaxID=1121451 RepID=L0RCD6_9BACT|nr:hypothetical protein [Maridesulfovibrio hydrothermalis]CCO24423.1 conserved protein of unknown function [Maridesulfovibrio hydrothermalis AM13 = DSM 14728]
MRIYLGFDDTDDKDAPIGTGRLVREFTYSLPDECQVIGVVRHQLPRLSDIPFTSNNSSACAIIEMPRETPLAELRDLAVKHILKHCAPGSDPGLCVTTEDAISSELVDFAKSVTGNRVTQKEATHITRSIELYGLGGTNDGIIGATAAVGLTKFGWCGRFIEYGKLRGLKASLLVKDINDAGIQVVSTDRDPLIPLPTDRVHSATWIRPSLWAGHPVLQVTNISHGVWQPAHGKRKKGHSNAA